MLPHFEGVRIYLCSAYVAYALAGLPPDERVSPKNNEDVEEIARQLS